MNFLDEYHDTLKEEPDELTKEYEQLKEKYIKRFGNFEVTTVFDAPEEINQKLQKCLELGVTWNNLYCKDIKKTDMI